MRAPFSVHSIIPVSGTIRADTLIPLVRARTVSITIQLYFEASMDANATVNLYYSPDGKNLDNIAFATWSIAYTSSTKKQLTKILDVPEHGYLLVTITNGSASYTITKIIMWYTIQSWPEVGEEVIKEILLKALAIQKQQETGQLGL